MSNLQAQCNSTSFFKWGVRVMVFITMGRSGICHLRFGFWFWLGRVALYTVSICLRLGKDWSNVLTEQWQLALLFYPMSCTDLVVDCSASSSAHKISRKLCDERVSAQFSELGWLWRVRCLRGVLEQSMGSFLGKEQRWEAPGFWELLSWLWQMNLAPSPLVCF